MAQVLGWDFRGPVRRNAAAFYGGRTGAEPSGRASRKEGDGHPSPGPAFAEILLNSESVDWVIGFYSNLRRIGGLPGLAGGLGQGWEDAPLAGAARQVIVLLCGLTGDVFGNDEGLKRAHLQRMLGGVMAWLAPADVAVQKAANGSESELLDGCRYAAGLRLRAQTIDQISVFLKKPAMPDFGASCVSRASIVCFWGEACLLSVLGGTFPYNHQIPPLSRNSGNFLRDSGRSLFCVCDCLFVEIRYKYSCANAAVTNAVLTPAIKRLCKSAAKS
jgi:hypothetical protein